MILTLPHHYGPSWRPPVLILIPTCRLTSQFDLGPTSSPRYCFMISIVGWTGHNLRVSPTHLTQVLWDGPQLMGALPYPPQGPPWLPDLGSQPSSCCSLMCVQLLATHSAVYPGSLCHAEETSCLQISCLPSVSPRAEVFTSAWLNMLLAEERTRTCGT